tara:strand:+ start:255 stop:551 length:297 start_codon:yes stop_codon:yes gene_type:complete
MEFEYFIIFGLIIIVVQTIIIFKLQSSVSNLRYEIKLDTLNHQKDLGRLEDTLNHIVLKDSQSYSNEITRLEKLHKSLTKLVDSKEAEISNNRKLLND